MEEELQTYEINLWLEKKIIEKIVKQFKDDKDVMDYIKDNFDTSLFEVRERRTIIDYTKNFNNITTQ